MSKDNISIGRIAGRIRHVRGEKMLLDYDLTQLYGVTPARRRKGHARRVRSPK